MVEPALEESFVTTGQAKFEYRDYAFLGEPSIIAAESARCADDQGMFWPYHDLIYANVDNPNFDGLSREALDLYASYLELDMTIFAQCMDDRVHQDAVTQERQQAAAIGISGTPAILLNGELVTGIETYDELFQMIEELVAGR